MFVTILVVMGVGLVISLVLVGIVLCLFLWRTTKRKERATMVEQETIEFKMGGGTLHEVLPNSPNVVAAENRHTGEIVLKPLIPDPAKNEEGPTADDIIKVKTGIEGWLWRNYGFAWIGWTYPLYHLFEFEIPREVLVPESEVPANTPLEGRIRHGTPVKVKGLRRFITRPILIRDIETSEGYLSHMLVEVVLEVVKPATIAIKLKGKPFPMVSAVISNAVGDFANDMKYVELRQHNKGLGSPFNIYMLGTNKTAPKDQPHGLIEATGMRIQSISVVGTELSEKSLAAENALAEQENAKNLGLAAVERATHEANAAVQKARGDAALVNARADALTGRAEHVVRALADMEVSKNLAGPESRISTLAIGSGVLLSTPSVSNSGGTTPTLPRPPRAPENDSSDSHH